jgi:diguanylate cyclase (GGDEF)-like protein/PAS domain S-box-containing protein
MGIVSTETRCRIPAVGVLPSADSCSTFASRSVPSVETPNREHSSGGYAAAVPISDAREDARLSVLESTRLLDSAPEEAFDRLTRLAAGLLGAPVALVSLVDDQRQFFKSALGLKEPWASRRETPLSHSICQYVTRQRAPVILSDAREHPVLRENLAIRDLEVVAYAGMPLVVADETIGSFCVIDDRPRDWSKEELRLLEDLGKSVVSEIELRLALRDAKEQRALTDALIESLGDAVIAVDVKRRFLVANQAARRIFTDGLAVGATLPPDWAARHSSLSPDGTPFPPENGALVRGLRGEETSDVTFTVQKEGAPEPAWLEASGRPVRAPDGSVIAAIAVYRNITERKRQADYYSALATNIPHASVALFDRDLRCLALEGGLLRELDLDVAAMAGRRMRELPGGSELAEFAPVEAAYRAALEGESSTVDYAFQGRVLELHIAPVRDQIGRVAAGMVLAFDRTDERAVQAALRRSEQVYRAIVKHLPKGGILMLDQDLRFVAADGPVIEQILRLSHVDNILNRSVQDLAAPENREGVVAIYRSTLQGNRHHVEIKREDRFFDLETAPIYEGDRVTHALVSLYDITDRKREAENLMRARALLGVTLENIEDGVALLDGGPRIVLANRSYGKMFDLPGGSGEGMTREEFFSHVSALVDDPERLAELLNQSSQPSSEDVEFVRPRRRILRRSFARIALPEGDGYLVTWHDVTAERDLLTERERQLLVDPLTGIGNRRAADGALRLEAERMRRAGTPLTVAVIDVDRFKRVNDDFGHAAGDEVLRHIASTLLAEKRVTDTVARWGGEEFLAILPVTLDGGRSFCERARRAVEALRCPPVPRITISAGVAELTAGESTADVVARADARLYEAKRDGRNRVNG